MRRASHSPILPDRGRCQNGRPGIGESGGLRRAGFRLRCARQAFQDGDSTPLNRPTLPPRPFYLRRQFNRHLRHPCPPLGQLIGRAVANNIDNLGFVFLKNFGSSQWDLVHFTVSGCSLRPILSQSSRHRSALARVSLQPALPFQKILQLISESDTTVTGHLSL